MKSFKHNEIGSCEQQKQYITKAECELHIITTTNRDVDISGTALSEPTLNEDFILHLSLINTGDLATEYQIAVLKYNDWAFLKYISNNRIILDKGESGYADIKLSPYLKGEHDFGVQVIFGPNIREKTFFVSID